MDNSIKELQLFSDLLPVEQKREIIEVNTEQFDNTMKSLEKTMRGFYSVLGEMAQQGELLRRIQSSLVPLQENMRAILASADIAGTALESLLPLAEKIQSSTLKTICTLQKTEMTEEIKSALIALDYSKCIRIANEELKEKEIIAPNVSFFKNASLSRSMSGELEYPYGFKSMLKTLNSYSATTISDNIDIFYNVDSRGFYSNKNEDPIIVTTNELNTICDAKVSNIEMVHIIVSSIIILLYLIYLISIKEPERLYAIIMGIQVIGSLFDISWFYFGIENFRTTVVLNGIVKILSVAAIFLFVNVKSDLWIYCLIIGLGSFISQVALWIPLKRHVSFVKPHYSKMIAHIKPMLVLFIPVMAVGVYKYMDKIMLGALSGKRQLGYYDNAEKAVVIPLTLVFSFGTVMIPRISNMITKKDDDAIRKVNKKSMLYIMWLSYALTFGLAAVAPTFSIVFWGDEFAVSGSIIIGLSVTIPFISFGSIIKSQYLIPNEKDRAYVLATVGGAIVNLISNIALIPRFGAIGATIGTILAEITACLILYYNAKRELPLFEFMKQSSVFFFLGICMFLAVYMVGYMMPVKPLTLILQIVIGIVIYGIGSLVYFSVVKDPMLRGLIDKAKRAL